MSIAGRAALVALPVMPTRSDELCLSKNLNPDILMMEPAEDWHRCVAAGLLPLSKIWSIFIQ